MQTDHVKELVGTVEPVGQILGVETQQTPENGQRRLDHSVADVVVPPHRRSHRMQGRRAH